LTSPIEGDTVCDPIDLGEMIMARTQWVSTLLVLAFATLALPAAAEEGAKQDKPNILVIWGDDIGQSNISAYTMGVVGYRTPNIDRVAAEGMIFTDYYGEQSCTAGRSSFITGQSVFRTGLSKVGMPGADTGLSKQDPTIAEPSRQTTPRIPSSRSDSGRAGSFTATPMDASRTRAR
jgi:hypothetical protein